MKLVIDIDDKDKKICEQYINGKLGDELGDYVNTTELADAIANGIPYDPKGDLISRSAVLEKLMEHQYSKDFCIEHGIEQSIHIGMVRIVIDNAPAVDIRNNGACEDCEYFDRPITSEPCRNCTLAHGSCFKEKEKVKDDRLQAEWIPVNIRLPEEDNDYIITYKSFGENVVSKSWFNTRVGFAIDNVIAWQPLPEPYKKGGVE